MSNRTGGGVIDRIPVPSKLVTTMGPILLLELALFASPLLIMIGISFIRMDDYQFIAEFTLEHYVEIFTSFENVVAIQNTVVLSVLVTVATAIIAYPTAYFIAQMSGEHKNQLALLVIVPFFTNYVVRIFGLRLFLSEEGVINRTLIAMGLLEEPLGWLINSRFAVWLGLVYLWLPFMILPLYSTLENIDRSIVEAAYDLGASRYCVFRRIILPLSLSGLVAGAMFVFLFSMGAFIAPSLLGGGVLVIGTRINTEFGFGANWPGGAALGTFLMIVVLLVIGTVIQYADLEAMFE